MTDPVTAALITTAGAIVVAVVAAVFNSRKSGNGNKNDKNEIQVEAATISRLATSPLDNTPSKLELIAAARAQNRRVCECTQSGEIMLLKRRGLGGDHVYECPSCGRREKANVPRHVF